MTAELFKNMPMDEYQANTKRISKSMLSVGADCWAKYKYNYIDGNYQPKETPALALGSCLHTLALEPEKFMEDYHILPEDHDGRTKQGKTNMEQALETGKTILKYAEYLEATSMARSVAENPLALALLKAPGHVEATIFWEEDINGTPVPMKCRPDFLRNDGLIIDVKTAKSVHPRVFATDAYKLKYPLSVAITCAGYKALYGKMPEDYIFLCIEKEPPYLVSCFSTFSTTSAMPSYLEYGTIQMEKLLNKYLECQCHNYWPTYQSTIEPISLPAYAEV